jgi:conjugal transfer pilus assembly protein TraV
MSGLDGETKFSCKAPDGVTCSSLSGVYANAVANNLPALRKEEKLASQAKGDGRNDSITGRVQDSGTPIRTQSKVLRIWIAPWEDSDGDLHDQSYVYVVADTGRWVIEHSQKRIIDRYRPTFLQAGKASQTQGKQTQPQQQPAGGGVVLPGAQGYGPMAPQQPNSGGQE